MNSKKLFILMFLAVLLVGSVSASILNKPSTLTSQEYAKVQLHVLYGSVLFNKISPNA